MGRANLGTSGTTGSGLDFGGIAQNGIWNLGGQIASNVKRAVSWEVRPSNIFAGILTQVELLKQFDWNATDAEIKNMVQASQTQAAATWGAVVGQGIGRLAGLALGGGLRLHLPVLSSSEINRVIAERMIDNLEEESAEEVGQEIGAALKQTLFLGVNTALLESYLHFRSLLKSLPESTLSGYIGEKNAAWLKRGWGADTAPVLSFNAVMNEQVEKIKSPQLQAFAEEALEEAWSGFIESGFIIAASLDDAYSSARMQQLATSGIPRTIALIPNEAAPEEELNLLEAPQEQLIEQSITLLNQYRLIQSRDIGQIVGEQLIEGGIAMPQLRRLTIEFRSKATPPWIMPDGKRVRTVKISIPNPRTGLSKNAILFSAKPFQWGSYCATIHYADKRKTMVYGASDAIAIQVAKDMADLSNTPIFKITANQVVDTDIRLKRLPQMVYPFKATLMFRKNVSPETTLIVINSETISTEIQTMILWQDETLGNEPTTFS